MNTRNILKSISALLFTATSVLSYSQSELPAPAAVQQGKITLTHATIHLGNGQVLNNATISFENGKITFLAENPTFKTDETMGKAIDCTGKHIYPGIIAPNTKIGLDEIEAVRATNDFAEVGAFNPDARAIIAYNTDSRVTPTIRSNGVLYAQSAPQGGYIAGTSAVVQLDAWNWEDALVKEDGIWMNWPGMFRRTGWWAEPGPYEMNKEYDKQVQTLKDYFSEARSYYQQGKHDKTNLRFEAMKGLFDKSKKLYVNVDYVKEIQQVIAFADEYGIKLVISGGRDSYLLTDVLAEKNIPVILGTVHSLPNTNEDDVNQPYKTPGLLQKAGVLFCLSISEGFWQERNLPFMAGTAAAHGLTPEEALSSITYNAAKILGVDSTIGTLEKGKMASLIVSTGDVLDMRTSNIELAFINGRQIDLGNKQKTLNEKYLKKYGVN